MSHNRLEISKTSSTRDPPRSRQEHFKGVHTMQIIDEGLKDLIPSARTLRNNYGAAP